MPMSLTVFRPDEPGDRPLTRIERRWVWVVCGTLLLYGAHVERRSVYLQRRMTDLGVYLRAAWAVRTGADPYAVTDTNGFHYVYPPLFAVLLTPFAEGPPGPERGAPRFAVSVALWYAVSVLCLLWAVHWLAGALERAGPARRTGGWRWWALRLLPVVACLPTVLGTLVHGQVNLLMLALVCGMAGALLRGRRLLAGLFLGGAVCLKVFPAFLLLHALRRRDGRCVLGCVLGVAVGVGLIPGVVFGPARALELHRRFAEVVLWPGLGIGSDRSRAAELTEITSTDTQALVAVIHNTLHPARETRPHQPSPLVRGLALLGCAALTGLTVGGSPRRGRQPELVELFALGQLVVVMLLLCPVCHLSYFCLTLPLVMAVVEAEWIPAKLAVAAHDGDAPGTARTVRLMKLGFVAYVAAHTLPHVPRLELLRDLGLAAYAGMMLWVGGLVIVRRLGREPTAGTAPAALRRAAA